MKYLMIIDIRAGINKIQNNTIQGNNHSQVHLCRFLATKDKTQSDAGVAAIMAKDKCHNILSASVGKLYVHAQQWMTANINTSSKNQWLAGRTSLFSPCGISIERMLRKLVALNVEL